MLTTSDRDEDIIRSYGSGAYSYIRKPVDLHEFKEVVKHFELYWTSEAESDLAANQPRQ